MNKSFFAELLQSIAQRARTIIDRGRADSGNVSRPEDLIELCDELLSARGEAVGVVLAEEILQHYAAFDHASRAAFFEALLTRFGPDRARLSAVIEAWQIRPSDELAAELHSATEPRRQELLRRLNFTPTGTRALVRMREQLLESAVARNDFRVVDQDFLHLFASWFNRGFLVLRRIDWSVPAAILEKIIRYEAVHAITGWDDLRRRIDSPDRRCYAFFHPALVDEPLIFVEVAITRDVPEAIAPILAEQREILNPGQATTAVFYSISRCHRGLAGVPFGHFLIKQVVREIANEIPQISNFVTLSPIPGFAAWLAGQRPTDLPVVSFEDRKALARLHQPDWWKSGSTGEALREPLTRLAAHYLLHVRNPTGAPADSVARFHLGNGAQLERINWLADTSPLGLQQSRGIMVNYLYDLAAIEKNHEAYAEKHAIAVSSKVRHLAQGSRLEVVRNS